MLGRAPTWIVAVGLSGLVSIAASSGQTPPPQQSPPTGLIVGQVIDADSGRPVGESIVTLIGGPGGPPSNPVAAMASARKVITDSNGRFVYRELAKGQYTLTVMKPGYVSGNYAKLVPRGSGASFDLADGGRLIDVRILVWKHAAITGRVVDEAGEPVVAAEIRVERVTTLSGRPGFSPVTPSGSVVTDDRGVYRVPALEPGGYVVGVAATSTTIPAAMVEEYFRAAAGNARVEMQQALFAAAPTMSSPGSARNQVIGDHILQVQGRMPTPPEPAADGTQAVYAAVFYSQATRTADATVMTLRGGETRAGADMQLRAVPSARVSGKLEGPDGPVGVVALYLLPGAGQSIGSTADAAATTVADASGAFTFLGVPLGQYTLFALKQPVSTSQVTQMTVVQGPGGTSARGMVGEGGDDANAKPAYWAQQALAVADGNVVDVRVVMRTGLRVSGKVVFEGATPFPAGQRVAPFLEATARWQLALSLGGTTVGSDGTFTLPGSPAGRYILTVPLPSGWYVRSAMAGGKDLADLPFELTDDISDVVVTVSDRGARVSGTVLDRDSKADPGAGVVAFPVDARYWVDFSAYARRIKESRTGRDGSFSLSGMPAGDYFVVAVPQAAMDWSVPALLERLSRVATRISLAEGERKTVDLRTAQVPVK